GPPRSANSFAVEAFRLAQGRAVPIGHHTHQPAQVLEAVRRRLPVMVLVREPVEVATSTVIRAGIVSPARALKDYCRFYETILPSRGSFVVAPFEEVV